LAAANALIFQASGITCVIRALDDRGLRARCGGAAAGKPFLGICLGCSVYPSSEEAENLAGLGIFHRALPGQREINTHGME